MTLTEIARPEWQTFFDRASKALGGRATTVEVAGLGLGDHLAAEHVELVGLTYEPKEDTLTIAVEGLEHRIEHPKRIHAEWEGPQLASVEVIGADDTHHIVQFTTPLELPAP